MTTYLTPGPSQVHPTLREYLDDAWEQDIPSISHRGKAFSDIYQQTETALRQLMDIPADYQILFVGSATEAMERIMQSLVASRSHHFVSGAFSSKWLQIAKQLGKNPTSTITPDGHAFADLTAPEDTELVCITHNETSTGALFPAKELAVLTSLPHRPLVALDVVSSAPMIELPWTGLDAVFFSVQKAFGLPAGLGVLIVSPRALAAAHKHEANGLSLGSYHSLPQLSASAQKFQTPATPNVLSIYLLGRVAADMAKNIKPLRRKTLERANALYKTLEASDYATPFVSDPQWRSPTVVVAEITGGNKALYDSLVQAGLVPGQGYKVYKEAHVRIANFPAVNDHTFETLLRHLRNFTPDK